MNQLKIVKLNFVITYIRLRFSETVIVKQEFRSTKKSGIWNVDIDNIFISN